MSDIDLLDPAQYDGGPPHAMFRRLHRDDPGHWHPDPGPELLGMMRLMMLNMDPPQHTAIRGIVNRGFTPRRIAALTDRDAAANRDEAVFAEPDRFDVARTPNDHVAFGGGGAHFCLGAHLARLESRALLHEVLARRPDLALAGPVGWLPSIFINGPRTMPMRFTPTPRSCA